MQCDIYKASTRDEMYIYLARSNAAVTTDGTDSDDPLAIVPAALRKALGRPRFVMSLDLANTLKLARVSIDQVRENLQAQGYFVQFPPDGLISPTAVAPEGLRGA